MEITQYISRIFILVIRLIKAFLVVYGAYALSSVAAFYLLGIVSDFENGNLLLVSKSIFLVAMLVIIYLNKDFKRYVWEVNSPLLRKELLIFPCVGVALFLVDSILQTRIISNFAEEGVSLRSIYVGLVDYFSNWHPMSYDLATIVATILVAPIVEEVAFRGILQGALLTVGVTPYIAVPITSALWAADHEGVQSSGGWLSIFIIGSLLSLVRLKSGNVLPCIVIHSVINASWVLTWLTIGA